MNLLTSNKAIINISDTMSKLDSIYNKILNKEKSKLEENFTNRIYNLIMKEIDEKPIDYCVSKTDYIKLFKKNELSDEDAIMYENKLNEELKQYEKSLEQDIINLMIDDLNVCMNNTKILNTTGTK